MITLTQLLDEMKAYAMQHKMVAGAMANQSYSRKFEYSKDCPITLVVTRDILDELGGVVECWHISISHENPKNELPVYVIQEVVNVFFGSDAVNKGEVLMLPIMQVHPNQRQFVQVEKVS